MKAPTRTFLALSLPIMGAAIAFTALQSWHGARSEGADLALPTVRLDVRPDRRVVVAASVVNQGAAISTPARLYLLSTWGERGTPLSPLRPGEERSWTWISPPLRPGDHAIALSIESDRLDFDESNNQIRRVVHVPGPAEGSPSGPGALMPSVVGLDRLAAALRIRDAGLPEPRWYEYARRVTVDRIDQQWPEAGQRIGRSTVAVLVVGAEMVVPDVRGLSLDQARNRIEQAGLRVGPVEVDRSAGHQARRVANQEPSPGARIELASAVRLAIEDPQPLWPFVIAGVLCLIGLMLSLGPPAPAFENASPWRSSARFLPQPSVPEPTVRSLRELPPGAITPLEDEPDVPVLETRPWPSPASERQAAAGERFENNVSFAGAQGPQVVAEWDRGRQEVSWHLDTACRHIALRLIRDPGEQTIAEREGEARAE